MNEPRREELIDGYARGELTGDDARSLARQALEDEDLFEELTSAALARLALSSVKLEEPKPRAWFARPARMWAGLGTAAAAIAIGVWLYPRSAPQEKAMVTTRPGAAAVLKPALALAAQAGQPILLTSDLQAARPQFRGRAEGSRAPRLGGSIVAVEDGIASIDLGSLDGLARGTQLPIVADGSGRLEGSLTVTDVFRERARGRMRGNGEARPGMKVRVPDAAHWAALLDRLDNLGQGDLETARRDGQTALEWARKARLAAGLMRAGWLRLAALDLKSGGLADAERHQQAAVDSLEAAPPASMEERAAALNDLAVCRLLRGDLNGAEESLNQAAPGGSRRDAQFARRLNNIGVLAELRGDRRLAESSYTDARRVLAGLADVSARDRQVVEDNLSRLRARQ